MRKLQRYAHFSQKKLTGCINVKVLAMYFQGVIDISRRIDIGKVLQNIFKNMFSILIDKVL